MKLSVLTGIFLQIVYSLELDHIPPMPDIDQISTDEVILKVWGSDSLIGIYCDDFSLLILSRFHSYVHR